MKSYSKSPVWLFFLSQRQHPFLSLILTWASAYSPRSPSAFFFPFLCHSYFLTTTTSIISFGVFIARCSSVQTSPTTTPLLQLTKATPHFSPFFRINPFIYSHSKSLWPRAYLHNKSVWCARERERERERELSRPWRNDF